MTPAWFRGAGQIVDSWYGHYTTAVAYETLRGWGWDPGHDREVLDEIVKKYLLGCYGDSKASGPVLYGPEWADAIAADHFGSDAAQVIHEVVEEGEEWVTNQLPGHLYCGPDYVEGAWGIWEVDRHDD